MIYMNINMGTHTPIHINILNTTGYGCIVFLNAAHMNLMT